MYIYILYVYIDVHILICFCIILQYIWGDFSARHHATVFYKSFFAKVSRLLKGYSSPRLFSYVYNIYIHIHKSTVHYMHIYIYMYDILYT